MVNTICSLETNRKRPCPSCLNIGTRGHLHHIYPHFHGHALYSHIAVFVHHFFCQLQTTTGGTTQQDLTFSQASLLAIFNFLSKTPKNQTLPYHKATSKSRFWSLFCHGKTLLAADQPSSLMLKSWFSPIWHLDKMANSIKNKKKHQTEDQEPHSLPW